jgi:hypothetical protein
MKTYQFTAFHDERYAAKGDVQADSPEEAKAKILERYHEGDLIFCEYVDGDEPDHFMLTDEAGEEYHLEDETPPDVLKALKTLIQKADDLIAAIDLSSVASCPPKPWGRRIAKVDGTTGQFEAEVSALSEATSAAEKAMQETGGAS